MLPQGAGVALGCAPVWGYHWGLHKISAIKANGRAAGQLWCCCLFHVTSDCVNSSDCSSASLLSGMPGLNAGKGPGQGKQTSLQPAFLLPPCCLCPPSHTEFGFPESQAEQGPVPSSSPAGPNFQSLLVQIWGLSICPTLFCWREGVGSGGDIDGGGERNSPGKLAGIVLFGLLRTGTVRADQGGNTATSRGDNVPIHSVNSASLAALSLTRFLGFQLQREQLKSTL